MTHPSLLLLHGALGSSAQFELLIPALSETFTCHTLDFGGHGLKPSGSPRASFRIEEFAQDVLSWLDGAQIATIDIFGYSMGGYVAMYLAQRQPERVGRIMTLGTKYLWTREAAAREMQALNPETIEQKVPHFARALELRHAAPWQTVVRHTRQMIEELGQQSPISEDGLGQIDHTVRVAVGDRDSTVPVEEAAQVARAMKRGELEVLPNTPHPLERVPAPRLLYSIVDFFTRDPAS